MDQTLGCVVKVTANLGEISTLELIQALHIIRKRGRKEKFLKATVLLSFLKKGALGILLVGIQVKAEQSLPAVGSN